MEEPSASASPLPSSTFVDATTTRKARVYVHVYDLNRDVNAYTWPCGLGGIFHTGTEVTEDGAASSTGASGGSAAASGASVHGNASSLMRAWGGREYAFGYHEYANETGVFDIAAKSAPFPAVYRETLDMGESELTREAREQVIGRLKKEFTGPSYDLLERNCNTFTEALVLALTGRKVPGWVNRLATKVNDRQTENTSLLGFVGIYWCV